jgi:hypothetical protein
LRQDFQPHAGPEQLALACEPKQHMNRLEGLCPWQPQKIYYFSNPTPMDFFTGQGSAYPSTGISPVSHKSYGQMAAEEFTFHKTQRGGRMEERLFKHDPRVLDGPIPLTKPSRFILV